MRTVYIRLVLSIMLLFVIAGEPDRLRRSK